MKRYYSLWKSTWWLWVLIFGGMFFLSRLNDILFYASMAYLPICLVTFLWFGLVRFDDHGNEVDAT
ncbi:hypothetical protein LOC68_21930 [Blastopirellula sp. JC732]|uniref:Uncharacterized protein n=1 Tax=Blastopirellula sediminis TaxID=2894196 RepID=A0A9X1SHC7_9BACT|nr:hypothetical protein [Blastopirellula sediminis]MCC9605640.1 hypothetical protein [Blastopirellula sediminis]MCC9631060.1 hypothetical protein [Blastopirellula sediminis]